MKPKNLHSIRKELDKIDAKIVGLLARRQSYMPAVARYKKENDLPVYHPRREKQIIESKVALAKDNGVDPSLVKKIFLLIFKESRKIQKHTISSKQ